MEEKEKKCFVHIENYTGEEPIMIIYREDEPAKHHEPIPVKMPQAVNISGTIHTVLEWLEKRKELVNINNCRLEVDREEGTMNLIVNETDARQAFDENEIDMVVSQDLGITFAPTSTIEGHLEFTEQYKDLHVNQDMWWNPSKLSKFLRLNRVLFGESGKQDGMALISSLKNVKAKISSDYEKKKELHGQISKTEYFSQEVSHNLPEKFYVEIAIFKGSPKERYEVEIDADIVDGEIQVQLLSPAMNDDVENASNLLINKELEGIMVLCPELVIVEV